MALSDDELDRIEARCAAASPAPWIPFYGPGFGGDDFIQINHNNGEPDMYVNRDGKPSSHADLEFIAEARQDVPRLIAEIRRLRSTT